MDYKCHHCACLIPEKEKNISLFSKNIKRPSKKLKNIKCSNISDLLFRE